MKNTDGKNGEQLKGRRAYSSLPTEKRRRLPVWSDRTPRKAALMSPSPAAGETKTSWLTSVRTVLPNTSRLPSCTQIPDPTVIFFSLSSLFLAATDQCFCVLLDNKQNQRQKQPPKGKRPKQNDRQQPVGVHDCSSSIYGCNERDMKEFIY